MTPAVNAPTSLADWLALRRQLQRNGPEATLVLGGTGHLLLSADEEAEIGAHLIGRVLPDIAQQNPRGSVLVVTGAAPGADLVFNRIALDWFHRVGIPCHSVALLPVPPDWLFRDWELRLRASGSDLDGSAVERNRSALERLLREARYRVPLYPGDEAAERLPLGEPDWRNEQYRRLAACLAEQCDILVAMLRAQNLRSPGGTAEVVDWRRHVSRIPPALSTLAPQVQEPPGQRRPLIVIDPSVAFSRQRPDGPATAPLADPGTTEDSAVLAEAEAAMRNGNDLHCHDLLTKAAQRGLRSSRVDYLRILTLANVGNTQLALERYRGLVLAPDDLSEDWLALQGRLEKDLALGAGEQAREHFLHAARAYTIAFERWRGAYSGSNAATMYCMAGEPVLARELALAARAALQEAAHAPAGSETALFFRCVTEAEIALHLGEIEVCRERLQAADGYIADDVVRRGRTLRQLRRLCDTLGIDAGVLAALRQPAVVLLRRAGHRTYAEAAAPVTLDDGFERGMLAFMALIDRSDLALAESLVERGLRLYPVLARLPKDAIAGWSLQYGRDEAARFAALLQRAERTASVPGFLDEEAQWTAEQTVATALGVSLLSARRLGCPWRLVELRSTGARAAPRIACVPVPAAGLSGEALQQGRLPSLPLPAATHTSSEGRRRMVGILFADFAGFSRIPDAEMSRFWREIMLTMTRELQRYGSNVLHGATWGDALHVVTADATTTAEIAADLLQLVERRRLQRSGVLSALELRVAAHYAPAFEESDPLHDRPVYYGSQISFAARIEPVTPPGTVFGSDAFVARLMLESPQRFSAEYAGEIELAKKHGVHPLFAVHRRGYR